MVRNIECLIRRTRLLLHELAGLGGFGEHEGMTGVRIETPIKLHFSLPASPKHATRPPSSVVSSTRHRVSGQRAASAPATRGNTGACRLNARLGLREFSRAVVRVDSKRRVGRAVCAIVSHRS